MALPFVTINLSYFSFLSLHKHWNGLACLDMPGICILIQAKGNTWKMALPFSTNDISYNQFSLFIQNLKLSPWPYAHRWSGPTQSLCRLSQGSCLSESHLPKTILQLQRGFLYPALSVLTRFSFLFLSLNLGIIHHDKVRGRSYLRLAYSMEL